MAKLTWALTDFYGRRIGQFWDRSGGQVSIALNGQRTARVTVSLEDEAVRRIYPLATMLKVYYGEKLLLHGPLTVPSFRAGTQAPGETSMEGVGAVELAAVDASHYLTKFHAHGLERMDDVLQAQIMARLMEHADASHGIIRGTLDSGGVKRDRHYPDGKNIWEAIVELSAVNRGPDFELEPLDREDGVRAQLNTFFPRQGTNKHDTVILEYGLGRMNAADFRYEPDGTQVVNRYILSGQAINGKVAKAYRADQLESQQLFGMHQLMEARPDINRVKTLREHAEGFVAAHAFPIDYFDVTPAVEQGGAAFGYRRDPLTGEILWLGEAYAIPPRFGPGPDFDYWIGDTIAVHARLGPVPDWDHPEVHPSIDLPLRGRITDATIMEIDQEGNVMVDLTCAPIIEAAQVSGFETTVSVRDSF